MDFLQQAALVGLGGFLGSISRFLISSRILFLGSFSFPLATLAVNLIGSFFIGLIAGFFKSNLNHANHNLWLFLIIGYLGSFTTFSSLSLEAHELVEKSSYFIFTAYILVHFILGISLTFLGLKISSS